MVCTFGAKVAGIETEALHRETVCAEEGAAVQPGGEAICWWDVLEAADGDVGCEFAAFGFEAEFFELAVDAPFETAERVVLGDADPERSWLAARRELTDALKGEVERLECDVG